MRINYLNHMGDDLTVVNAARVSMDKWSDELTDKDVRLIGYLANHNHWTPFAHPQIQYRVTAPIFIARQWSRHTVGIARNEVSRRYVDDVPECWAPETVRARPDGSIKQGSGGEHEASDHWRESMRSVVDEAMAAYSFAIEDGVAPEQARAILPQGAYTQWIETASLAAVARICQQRIDAHAQVEIRELAEQLEAVAENLFPHSMAALME